MSSTKGEDFVRLEHKLDAILTYLSRLTGEKPIPMPKPIVGLDGMTESKCPITQTPIFLRIDPRTGKVVREDGLSTGLIEAGPIVDPPRPTLNRAIKGGLNFGGEDD